MEDTRSPGRRRLEKAVKAVLRAYFRLVHRARVVGLENLPRGAGKLVIVSNHGSLFDGPFLWAFLPLEFTTVISREIAEKPVLRSVLSGGNVVKVEALNSFSLKHVVRLAAAGRPLLIFPEGRRSVTGGFMKIYEGAGFVAYRAGATVLPVYIKNTYRIITSRAPGRKDYFAPLTLYIGKPAPPFRLEHLPVRTRRKEAASRIYGLLSNARFEATTSGATLGREFIRLCRENGGRPAFNDVTRREISFRKALVGAFLLGGYFSRYKDRTVGLLLPNLSVTALLFLGLQLHRKTAAFLNYASGIAPLQHMMGLADLRLIVTSREFLERINMKQEVFAGRELVFLEDVQERLGRRALLSAFWKALFADRYYREPPGGNRETAVILFTSGSEGTPKGVCLSHENLITNIHQCLARIDVNGTDSLLNALPLFHSFGLTAGTLMPLFAGARVFLYVSPLHFRVVPETAYRENCTVLLGTNIFLNGYARRAHPFDFHFLRYIYCGAEALLDEVFEKYARTFGKRVMSGYGVTECSPVISMNNALEYEYGSVGKFLPGMEYRVEPVEGMDSAGGRRGLLYVRGKNVMKGYLKNEAANRKIREQDRGWYDTGDIVELSENGFLRIVGRRKRFAKVSGEMVSLAAIEEALAYAFGERREAAVTAVPDVRKGERIVLVANHPSITLRDARDILRIKGFSELAQPREIRYLRDIPKLATGKVDYVKLNALLAENALETAKT